MSDKINSTRNILQLARTPENMNTLVENGTEPPSIFFNNTL